MTRFQKLLAGTLTGLAAFQALTVPRPARAGPATATSTTPAYTFTIFVKEGIPNGHVYVGLSDGPTTTTLGFYPVDNQLSLFGKGGGELRSDDGIKDWTVKKQYVIDGLHYEQARKAIADWQRAGRSWSPW